MERTRHEDVAVVVSVGEVVLVLTSVAWVRWSKMAWASRGRTELGTDHCGSWHMAVVQLAGGSISATCHVSWVKDGAGELKIVVFDLF